MASIYLHIPFCVRKCIYCDFYSIEDQSSRRPFLEALRSEIALRRGALAGAEISTMYFGGGTPSLLDPDEIGGLLLQLRECYRVSADAEITLEANPGTIDRASLSAYRGLGVNRLSLGIQSFREEDLRFLGRIHTAEDARRAMEDARAAGFDNVSIDLIFSLPGETVERWESTLRQGIALRPDHISAYSLIVEENTPLHRLVGEGRVVPNRLEAEAELYERTMVVMGESGFEQYEISSYARAGARCRHNLAYWAHAEYIGFGPSAHSFLRDREGGGRRWWNVSSVGTYCSEIELGRLPVEEEEGVDRDALLRERIFLGLRSGGIDLRGSRGGRGFVPDARQRGVMSGCVAAGLAKEEGGIFRLTPRGVLLCDEIAARLLP